MKANIKNRWHSVIPASGALFASLFAVALAQTTPTSPSVTPEPETIQLSPFEVTLPRSFTPGHFYFDFVK